jgi:hypothetical protein
MSPSPPPHRSNTTDVDRRTSGGHPDPWIRFSPEFEGPHGPLPPGGPSEKVGGETFPHLFMRGFRREGPKVGFREALLERPGSPSEALLVVWASWGSGGEMGEKSSPVCV